MKMYGSTLLFNTRSKSLPRTNCSGMLQLGLHCYGCTKMLDNPVQTSSTITMKPSLCVWALFFEKESLFFNEQHSELNQLHRRLSPERIQYRNCAPQKLSATEKLVLSASRRCNSISHQWFFQSVDSRCPRPPFRNKSS
jgi:hypothetical protein